MPAFLLAHKLTTWFGDEGQILAGGYLKFFESDTTTPQDVYGERALSTNNGDTIGLDASGRLEHECWADAANAYYVELYDSADVKQGEISYVEVPGGTGQTIPVPSEGEFLTGDGTNFAVAEVRQVPDPTGNSNKLLSTDGVDLQWVARPADGAAGVSDTSTSDTGFTVGNVRVQWGTGSGTNSGGRTQTATITFPVPFSAAPHFVDVVLSNSNLASSINMPSHSVTNVSTTGATIKFTMGEQDDDGSTWDFNAAAQFRYWAVGPK
jgi:hypothetical protein